VGPEAAEDYGVRRALVAAALFAATLAAGCGEKSEHPGQGSAEAVRVDLDFYVNPDHAGLFEGLDRGYFDEAGLDVETEVPSDPSAPIRQVAAGRADLAISYEPEVILARDQGLPVKAVAAVVAQPLTSLIWLRDSGIRDVGDLAGKTIATAGIPYQSAFLEQILARADLTPEDVQEVNVGLGLLPALLSDSAQAMLGGFLNVEGVDLAQRGRDPVVRPVDELGIPTYDELVLVANSDRLADDPEPVRLFIAALERGTKAAVADPAAATQAVLDAGDGLDPKLTRAEIDATLPLLLPDQDGNPYGYMDPKAWERFAGFFADHGLIDSRPTADQLLTNEYLPGRIPD
jgi:putative hydroxymethylpyrimidine transport system substrate-binding protein